MRRAPIVAGAAGGDDAPFRLVCACCRWPASEARDADVRRKARQIADWNEVLHVARRHRVIALASQALQAAGVELPGTVADALAEEARQAARQSLAMVAETLRLQGLLDGAHIANVVLKGAALAYLAYGTPSLKHGRDIDLLVPPEEAAEALELLEGLGYVIQPASEPLSAAQRTALIRFSKDIELAHPFSGMRVELHWLATYNRQLPAGVDARSPTQSIVVGADRVLRTLATEQLFAYLCVHGALHAWWRLKWLADLNALLAVRSREETARLFEGADKLGAGLCAGQALLLCHRLLGLELDDALRARLEGSRRLDRLVAVAHEAMAYAPKQGQAWRPLTGVRALLLPFRLGKGWRYFAAQLRVAAVGPADVARYPLPPPLHFLYPALRLPLWLHRHARHALEAGRWSPNRP